MKIAKKSALDRQVFFLALVSLRVCDELAQRGRERSDIPRLWLEMLVRHHRGQALSRELAAATREFTPWRIMLDGESGTDRAWRQWWRAMGLLHRVRRGLITEARASLLQDTLPEVLVRLGEARPAAEARVRQWYEDFARQEAAP